MSDILHQDSVLVLNNIHMRLGFTSPATAFAMLMGGAHGDSPAKAIDVHYKLDEFGMPILEKMEWFDVLEWEYWMMAEPRRGELDQVIHTPRRILRVPTIITCTHYDQMPKKQQKATPRNIRKRDGNRCQYTGVELTNKTFSLDHVIPRSKGGKDNWENLVSCHKDVNSKKGDKFNHEAGLRLTKRPIAPKSIPLCALVTDNKHPDHFHFK